MIKQMWLRINKNDMLLIWEALVGYKSSLELNDLKFDDDQILLVKKLCKQTDKEYESELWES